MIDKRVSEKAVASMLIENEFLKNPFTGWRRGPPRSILVAALIVLFSIVTIAGLKQNDTLSSDGYKNFMAAAKLSNVPPSAVPEQLLAAPERQTQPAYVLLVKAMSYFDSGLASALSCAATPGQSCSPVKPFASIIYLQIALALACLGLIFAIAYIVTGAVEAAWVAIILAAMFRRIPTFSVWIDPNVSFTFVFLLFILLSLLALKRNSLRLCLAAGFTLGLGAMLHSPSFYLLPIMSVAFLLLRPPGTRPAAAITPQITAPAGAGSGAARALSFTAGALVLILPVSLYNYYTFNDPFLAVGYEAKLLAERAAYNAMTAREWFASLVYWFPLGGERITAFLFGADAATLLGWWNEGAYRYTGLTRIYPEALKAGPGAAAYSAVVRDYIIAQPLQHIAVSFSLFLKGFWQSGGLLTIPAILLLPTALRIARNRGEAGLILLLLVCVGGLLAIHSVISINLNWDNLATIVMPSCILAYIARAL